MPRFNGMGPLGFGPGTGRGLGPCGFGFGGPKMFHTGRGLSRYFGWNWSSPTKDNQLKSLEDYQKALEEELKNVKQQIAALGKVN
jgi:hypothetical protein